jgi:peroxiredoxin Q/BCP
MTIEIGKKAPDFALPDHEGKNVSLRDLKGKWAVLYFYPKDDTPGCSIEGIEFTANKEAFEKRGAVVYGISGDDKESHCAFREKHDLGIPLLTDKDKTMMDEYGAYGNKMLYGKTFLGIKRSTVLIDPQGRVAYRWQKVKAEGHALEVLEKLEELQETRA